MSNLDNNPDRINPDLALWFEKNGSSIHQMSELIGVSHQFLYRALCSDSIPKKRHKQLTLAGIPENLLPPVFLGPTGRPPKTYEYRVIPPTLEKNS